MSQKTQAQPLNNPEVVFNLWAYSDEYGNIMRLAGKAYVLDGSDEAKLKTLRLLAASDFLSAAWVGVPKSIGVNRPGGQMRGVANTSLLSNPISHSALFNSLLETL